MYLLPVLLVSVLQLTSGQSPKLFSGVPTIGNHRPSVRDQYAGSIPGKPEPSEQYPYHAHFTQDYELHWKFNNSHITFETIVKTKGWVGLGLSTNGKMYPSDVVMGWVKDGQAHFLDMHTDGHRTPLKDESQDWFLLAAKETGDWTVLKMIRKFDTCDPQDIQIKNGTTRFIYAYHSQDPVSEDVPLRHEVRGTKSVLVLDPPAMDLEPDQVQWPQDLKSVDILNPQIAVPDFDTTYYCTMWKMPDLGGKHHMIRFEPVIQKGHERLLHHILIYYCTGKQDDEGVGDHYHCGTKNYGNCNNAFIAWAIGGTAFDYPAHVGQSFGTGDDPVYIKMETHYDNPDRRSDFVDNSGIRLFLTQELRKHDGGNIMMGLLVDNSVLIPPGETNFVVNGYCHEDCYGEALGDKKINVFATFLHSHLAGVGIRARHFRNWKELTPLSEDLNYDFDYQEQRLLPKEVVMQKGDTIVTECTYNTVGRKGVTTGGVRSTDEMCLSFILYYPRIPMTTCLARPQYLPPPPEYNKKTVHDLAKGYDFTNETKRAEFKRLQEGYTLQHFCFGSENGHYKTFQINQKATPQPTFKEVYETPSVCPGQ